jgi:acyl-CoA synthetase (AMP-forming)/AMP-acid ligase II
MIMPTAVNVAAALAEQADRRPYAPAVFCPAGRARSGRVRHTHHTFKQLHEESDRIAHSLTRHGLGRGCRTVLMVPPGPDFFALTFALFKIGAVPILIDPGMGVRNLGGCLAEARPEAFVGVPKAHLARWLLRWGRPTVRRTVAVGSSHFGAEVTLDQLRRRAGNAGPFPMADTRADETAAILFTSGSTGPAKGAVYTHGVFAAQVESLREVYGIEPGEIDLTTFPLFALFGPALGMTSVVPDMDPTRPARVDPVKIFDAIEDFGVTNLFGSPALLNRVGRYGAERGIRLPSLRRVISAGAPVPAVVIERFTKLLPADAQVFTPYGATEALPVANIGSREILGETRARTDRGEGVCVGMPVPGMGVTIIPISDDPIAEWDESLLLPLGRVGEIVVSGPVVTASYFNRERENALAKIRDPRTGVTRHRMGDVGYRDESGRIWFCGRKAHRVETTEGMLFTIPCEAVFNTHPDVFRSALVGVIRGGVTYPVVCVELEPDRRPDPTKLRAELCELALSHPHTRAIVTFLTHPAFPVDIRHNAKIFREKLAVWADRRLGRGWRP